MTSGPEALRHELDNAGYFPELAWDVIELALAGEEATSCLVVPESALGHGTIGWHLTVLVLTQTRLVVAHLDDSQNEAGAATAVATTTSVPLRSVRQVRVTQMVEDPAGYRPGSDRALSVAIGWGSHQAVDLEAANCPDPECLLDHGYQGNVVGEDITFMVSTETNGPELMTSTLAFLHKLWAVQSGNQP